VPANAGGAALLRLTDPNAPIDCGYANPGQQDGSTSQEERSRSNAIAAHRLMRGATEESSDRRYLPSSIG
jgi:hypothetical protein